MNLLTRTLRAQAEATLAALEDNVVSYYADLVRLWDTGEVDGGDIAQLGVEVRLVHHVHAEIAHAYTLPDADAIPVYRAIVQDWGDTD
jgi:hypothetical protein